MNILRAFSAIILVGAAKPVTSFLYQQGSVSPKEPYVEVGEQIVLNCSLVGYRGPETARKIFFTFNNTRIPSQFIHIKSRRIVTLRIPRARLENDGKYFCYLKQQSGSMKSLGFQKVTVDYKLESTKSINCTVLNWEGMVCTWKITTPYQHPENINVTLVWAVGTTEQLDCPLQKGNRCYWSWKDDQRSFKRDKMYYMLVIMDNVHTGDMVKSALFRIDTRIIVKPARVHSVLTRNINSTCITLDWKQTSANDGSIEKHYKLQYRSKGPSNGKVDYITMPTYDLCDLIPYTLYTITINCKPNGPGFWSDDVVIDVRTAEDVPSQSPELGAGNFVELSSADNTRKVVFFWKSIDEQYTNGVVRFYRLAYTDTASKKTKHKDISSSNHGLVDLQTDVMYRIQVTAWTSVGPSLNPYPILLPSSVDRPPYPRNFIVKASIRNQMTDIALTWEAPSGYGDSLDQYTIYWCVGSYLLKTCHSAMHWTNVEPSLTSFSLQLPGTEHDKYMYGISTDTAQYSSGVLWSRCTYLKSRAPTVGPQNLRVAETNPDNAVSLQWTEYDCDKTGYIEYFILYYCRSSTSNCTGNVHSQRIPGNALHYILTDLESDATYTLRLVAVTDGGPGPPSSNLLYTVSAPQGLSVGLLVGIIIGAVVPFFCIFCIIFLIIRHMNGKKRQDTKLEFADPPPLPNVQFPFKIGGVYDPMLPSPNSQTPFLSDREVTPMCTIDRSTQRSNVMPLNDLNSEHVRIRAVKPMPRNVISDGYHTIDSNATDTLPLQYTQAPTGVTTFLGTNGQLYCNQMDPTRPYIAAEDSGIIDQSEQEIDLLENSTTKLLPSTDDECANEVSHQELSKKPRSISEANRPNEATGNSSDDMSRSISRESFSSKNSARSNTPKLRHFPNRPLPELPSADRTNPYLMTDIVDTMNRHDDDPTKHEYHVIESDTEAEALKRNDSRSRALDFSHYVIQPHKHTSTLQLTSKSPSSSGARLAKTDDESYGDDRPLPTSIPLHNGDNSVLNPELAVRRPSDYMFHLPLQYYKDPVSRDDLPSTDL